MIKSPVFCAVTLCGPISYFSYVFMEPILAIRLLDYGLSKIQIGLFFAICPLTYMVSGVSIQYLPKWLDNRVPLFIASVLIFFGGLLIGPSAVFGFPDKLYIAGLG